MWITGVAIPPRPYPFATATLSSTPFLSPPSTHLLLSQFSLHPLPTKELLPCVLLPQAAALCATAASRWSTLPCVLLLLQAAGHEGATALRATAASRWSLCPRPHPSDASRWSPPCVAVVASGAAMGSATALVLGVAGGSCNHATTTSGGAANGDGDTMQAAAVPRPWNATATSGEPCGDRRRRDAGDEGDDGDLVHGGRRLMRTRRGGQCNLDGAEVLRGLLHAHTRRRKEYALTSRTRSNGSRRSHRTLSSRPAESLGRPAGA